MAPLYSPDSMYSYPGKQPQGSKQQVTEEGRLGLPEEEEEDNDDLPSLLWFIVQTITIPSGLGLGDHGPPVLTLL